LNIIKQPVTEFLTRTDLIQDLEVIFQNALRDCNYTAAIRAKELQGKYSGLMHQKKKISLKDMTEEDILLLIDEAKNIINSTND